MASSITQLRGNVTASGGAPIVPGGTPINARRTWRFQISQDSAVAGDTDIAVTLTGFAAKIAAAMPPGTTAAQLAASGEVILIPRNKAFHDASVRVDPALLGTGVFHLTCEAALGVAQYDVEVKFEHSIEL